MISVAGCATVGGRYHAADTAASESHFEKEYIKTGLCTLTAFYRFHSPGDPITIYIEGDGAAWKYRDELSMDPTPCQPIVLELAAIDPSENVAYLARPGQLTAAGKPDCDPVYWSSKRFSEEVIKAIDSAMNDLKAKSRSKEINLIGYSGGAAIAVIIAAQRNDIASLRTIAGNLDHEVINRYHNVAPLEGSLNPIDLASSVASIPQRHFAAQDDRVVPVFVIRSFAEKMGDKNGESVTIVKNTAHSSGWQKEWLSLLSLPLYKSRTLK